MNSNYINKIGLVSEYSEELSRKAMYRIKMISALLAGIAKEEGKYISSDHAYHFTKGDLVILIKFEHSLTAIDDPLILWININGLDMFKTIAEHQKTFYYYSIYLETIWQMLKK